jgi:hypothetical protein
VAKGLAEEIGITAADADVEIAVVTPGTAQK